MGYSLVLSGGGARGFFHVGVLKAIQELNIKIDEIAGTSIGAVVGAMYASDPDYNFDDLLKNTDFKRLIGIKGKGTGFLSSRKIEKHLKNIIPAKRFSELKLKLKFTAVDVNTGEEIDFDKGNIFPALNAAIAIPALFPLVKVNGRYLCDGGLLNEIPFSLISQRKKAIVSDLTSGKKKITDKSSTLNLFENLYIIPRMKLIEGHIKKFKSRKDVIYIEFHEPHNILDFRKAHLKKMMDLGYKRAMAKLKDKR